MSRPAMPPPTTTASATAPSGVYAGCCSPSVVATQWDGFVSCRVPIARSGRRLRGGLAALATGALLLRGGAALRCVPSGAGLLAAARRRARRVRDLGRPLLRHALVLEGLVLLLVLHARPLLAWHRNLLGSSLPGSCP